MGTSLALSPDQKVLAAGAYCHSNYAGSVFIFTKDGTGMWNTAAVLNAGEDAANSLFGYSVALTNDFMVASAYGDCESFAAICVYLLESFVMCV